eukprot:CAMPEP_0113584506 /NCGR_PEP_ID=MMETSP0015_2-20120614/33145_1 /TAXON_ID=2838 /ORGANISM="Odontella" /LENGTH=66 /DNA_ID=CAMNT_0000489571 /DNA_START=525 /DNA_END=722 /DNA_ORIENTATION=+ /assembly_acc=CAM_ASM_000160
MVLPEREEEALAAASAIAVAATITVSATFFPPKPTIPALILSPSLSLDAESIFVLAELPSLMEDDE